MSDTWEECEGCVAEKETPKALLVLLPSTQRVWVPKSVISDDSEVFTTASGGNKGTLTVARWFAEKEGIG